MLSSVNLMARLIVTSAVPPTPASSKGASGCVGCHVVASSTVVNGSPAALGKGVLDTSEKHACVMLVASPPPNQSRRGTLALASVITRKLSAFPTPAECHALMQTVSLVMDQPARYPVATLIPMLSIGASGVSTRAAGSAECSVTQGEGGGDIGDGGGRNRQFFTTSPFTVVPSRAVHWPSVPKGSSAEPVPLGTVPSVTYSVCAIAIGRRSSKMPMCVRSQYMTLQHVMAPTDTPAVGSGISEYRVVRTLRNSAIHWSSIFIGFANEP